MKKAQYIILFAALMALSANALKAQYLLGSDSAFNAGKPMTGHLWGYAFGDYYFKSHADALNRGGSNQYSGIPKDRNAFQFRRIYLGYDFNFNQKFSSELLLAAEDNSPAGNPPASATASGDELLNNKLSFYIKLADIRWKNIWKGTDLIIGQQATPAFPYLSEKIWNYRSVERTISDIRRTPSFDMGAGLQGTFDPITKNYGYNLLVANGTQAKPASNSYRWFYGDIWAKFFNQKIIIDLYADYNRLNWTSAWHHSRQMLKGFVAYNTAPLTIGAEGFLNNLKQDVFATKNSGGTDTLNNVSKGLSMYIHGDIIKNKLRFFARYDIYSPTNKVNNNVYNKYVLNTGNYSDNSYVSVATSSAAAVATGDETYKQSFITAGLDFTPAKNVHFMPNIWYNHYATQLSSDLNNTINGALASKAKGDYDLVYRVTFYFIFGK
ncbi:MAG: hypothetical protein LBE82_10760, partial [Chitinophagaceae bacterium]|jgi:hypothetical protein|nr:hypothetical protein [Chitinophagaceae bacterium]